MRISDWSSDVCSSDLPQWFIPMDRPSPLPGRGLGVGESISIPHPSSEGEGLSNAPTLRGIALDAIENTRWVPERSKNSIRSMVEGRPDGVISRHRAWGGPIALY